MAKQAAAYDGRVLEALAAGLHERLGAVTAAGHDLRELGTPDEVARRMLAVVPAAHPWDEQIGPFYDTAGLTRWLGVTEQALVDRVRRHQLLAVTTGLRSAALPGTIAQRPPTTDEMSKRPQHVAVAPRLVDNADSPDGASYALVHVTRSDE